MIDLLEFDMALSEILLTAGADPLLRLRVTRKALQLSLLSSFSFSLQQIWTDSPKLVAKFLLFDKLGECGLIQTH